MPRKILVIGAGKSTTYLLDYFLEKAEAEDLDVTIGDLYPDALSDSLKNLSRCSVVRLDIFEDEQRKKKIEDSDIVVSMLPAYLHIKVAKDCLTLEKALGHGILCQ